MTETPSGFPLLPRILFGLFALGSVASVIAVPVFRAKLMNELTENVRQELASYPVVAERLGEITSIELDPSGREEGAPERQQVLILRGSLEIGRIAVEPIRGAHENSVIIGDTLKLNSGEVLPLVRRE